MDPYYVYLTIIDIPVTEIFKKKLIIVKNYEPKKKFFLYNLKHFKIA